MTFFDWRDPESYVSPNFWIYWAVTLPLTFLIVAWYWTSERSRTRQYEKDDEEIEQAMNLMKSYAVVEMRKRRRSKTAIWHPVYDA
jgi:hypothetical protein